MRRVTSPPAGADTCLKGCAAAAQNAVPVSCRTQHPRPSLAPTTVPTENAFKTPRDPDTPMTPLNGAAWRRSCWRALAARHHREHGALRWRRSLRDARRVRLIINAYQLAMVATLPPFAALGGIVGQRRILSRRPDRVPVASAVCARRGRYRRSSSRGAAGLSERRHERQHRVDQRDLPHHIGWGRSRLNALVVGVAFAVGPTVAPIVLSLGTWPWPLRGEPAGRRARAGHRVPAPPQTPRARTASTASAARTR